MKMTLKNWQVLSSKTIIQDKWINLRSDRCVTQRGMILENFYVHNPRDWVLVVALTQNNDYVLVKQYRHGIQQIISEFSAGMIEENEDPIDAAKRELLEETGFSGSDFSYIGRFPTNPANASAFFHIILAKNLQKTHSLQLDSTEDIEISIVSPTQLQEMMNQNMFISPHHIAAYFLCHKSLHL
jgi:ADP-ribose pyrophosphatase